MKKAILILVSFILCISVFACDETPKQTTDESTNAQQAINTESGEQQSTTTSSDEETSIFSEEASSEYSEATVSEMSVESSEQVSDISTEPITLDAEIRASVIEVQEDAIILQDNYYGSIDPIAIKIRVKCANAADFCVYDYVKVTYNGVVDQMLGENYFEITAISVEYEPGAAEKPVIYLYPIEKTDISVKLQFNGDLQCTYPAYDDGWNVTAFPDGRVINHADGKEYSYLFWEGTSAVKYDMTKGFVVRGTDTAEFLQEKLSFLGLTPKEYNEFIVYWLPKMQNNEYNLITFQGEVYTDNAILDISPQPDSILRVFMAYKPLDKFVEIEEQQLQSFTRSGFAVVEWGGTSVE